MKFIKKLSCIFISLVFLILSSCSNIKPISPLNNDLKIPKSTLENMLHNAVLELPLVQFNGGKTFCDYIVIDSDKNEDEINIYLWLSLQEYYIKDENLTKGSGGDFSAVLKIKQEKDNYKFVELNISDANEVDESLKIFPESIRKKARENQTFDEKSMLKIKKEAEDYFKNLK